MEVIDLSAPIFDRMPVFPGDPEVRVQPIEQEIEENPWYMKQLTFCTHDATHLNVPSHTHKEGATLNDFDLTRFLGDAVLYENDADLQSGIGVVFDTAHDFTMEIAERAVAVGVKFVALANDFDLDVERYTLEKGLISYERLVNTDKLPKHFQFFGVPLSIRGADGSPVRAFAIV